MSAVASPSRTTAQLEQELVELIASCADDPVAFARVAFPWGEGELKEWPWEGKHCGLDDWQLKILEDLRDGLATALRCACSAARCADPSLRRERRSDGRGALRGDGEARH